MTESLGVYIHIPFCIQRCHYCDFATYSKDQIQANQDYVNTLCSEIRKRKQLFKQKKLSTIYFGGGTPSLLTGDQIHQIISEFPRQGFSFDEDIEITLEVNPATLTNKKALAFRKAGVNRISIGCQSFHDDFLKMCNREHSAQDSLDTIELVQQYFKNYSLDLLFALPKQDQGFLKKDLEILTQIRPPHVSAYCLTVPEKHPMNQNRVSDEEQTEMFSLIKEQLLSIGLQRYEISNFSLPGFESRHNNLYWEDDSYWGLGLSAHSYSGETGWGVRFWNLSSYQSYMDSIHDLDEELDIRRSFPVSQKEELSLEESLTDYCHTHLRLRKGVSINGVRQKFGTHWSSKVQDRLKSLGDKGWLIQNQDSWSLSDQGLLLSNQVFAETLFSGPDIDNS